MSNSVQTAPIVVTGSSGLLGERICQRLAKRYPIIGLDIKESSQSIDGLSFKECDFTDDESVRQAIHWVRREHGGNLMSVIHLAAYYDFAGEPSPLYQELTVEGTKRLLQDLQEFETVEQFVYSSSLLVMKPCEIGETLTESSPTHAEWDYPKSKLAAEEVIRQHRGNIPSVVLRIAGVYDDSGHSIPITQNIRRIAEKEMESYFFPGDADRGQSFVHLDDVVDFFEAVVDRRHQLDDQDVFLIGEEECLSYEQLQDIIGELVHGNEDWPTIRIPKLVAKTGAWIMEKLASSKEEEPFIKPWMVDMADAHYPVDNSLAQSRLQWRPQHCLSETLPKMIERLKRDPQQWYKQNNLPLPEDRQQLQQLVATR